MIIRTINRMLVSQAIQEWGKGIRDGTERPPHECNSIAEFETWRISFINRLLAEPYNQDKQPDIPYVDLDKDLSLQTLHMEALLQASLPLLSYAYKLYEEIIILKV